MRRGRRSRWALSDPEARVLLDRLRADPVVENFVAAFGKDRPLMVRAWRRAGGHTLRLVYHGRSGFLTHLTVRTGR